MGQLPLERFTVLDLTRVRSGPTCVRQLADFGANVIKIDMPSGDPPNSADRATAPTFRTCTATSAASTLDLEARGRTPQSCSSWSSAPTSLVENFRPDVKHRLGIDYETAGAHQPAPGLRQHLRLRPGRAVRDAAGRRSDRAGHGRTDVDHRAARSGARARRHRDRRLERGHVLRPRYSDRAARARGVGAGAVGADLAARGADRASLDFQAARF